MMGVVDSAAALKHKGYWLESLLAGYLDQSSVHWRGRSSMQMYRGAYTGDANFFLIIVCIARRSHS